MPRPAHECMQVNISVGGTAVVEGPTAEFRDVWEATSFALERLQAAPEVSQMEREGLRFRVPPQWRMSYVPEWTAGIGASGGPVGTLPADAPRVAILREEGSNGDREMAAAVHAAGALPMFRCLSRTRFARVSLVFPAGVH